MMDRSMTERDRLIAGALEKGSRVMVLCNLDGSGLIDHQHPVFSGPAIVDLLLREPEDGLFGVFMVPDFLPRVMKARKVGVAVHVSQLSIVHPGWVVSYDERSERNAKGDMVTIPAMDWTDDGVVTR